MTEYLVTMTTEVPAGTLQAEVDDVRAREAAHSKQLAGAGSLLRLWRPPLQPGEWRTLGLFAATDQSELEGVLAGMPLRVWRSDAVVPLQPHPNDPGPGGTASAEGREFFTTFTVSIPADALKAEVAERTAGERRRTGELAELGSLQRLWSLPEEGRALGLWQASDVDELSGLLESLPLRKWLQVDTIPLAPHPSDPRRPAGIAQSSPAPAKIPG